MGLINYKRLVKSSVDDDVCESEVVSLLHGFTLSVLGSPDLEL
jgi:hypothetical protein